MVMQFVHHYEAQNDLEFVMRAIGHTHDIQHLLSGSGPTPAGEQALAIMNVTTMPRFFAPALAHHISLPNSFVSSAFLARTLFNYPAGAELILEAAQYGIAAGREVKRPLFMVDFESYLHWQLDEITRDLGFERGPGAAWDQSDALPCG